MGQVRRMVFETWTLCSLAVVMRGRAVFCAQLFVLEVCRRSVAFAVGAVQGG